MTNENTENVVDVPSSIFLSKEEIVDLTGVSIHTLNSWIKNYKPSDDEMETGRQNRRTYSKSYLLRVFEEIKREDLANLVLHGESLVKDEGTTSDKLGTNQEDTSIIQMLLLEKDKRIKNLENEIVTLKQELQIKNGQIQEANRLASQQQSLSLQQNRLFLVSSKNRPWWHFSLPWGNGSKKVEEEAKN